MTTATPKTKKTTVFIPVVKRDGSYFVLRSKYGAFVYVDAKNLNEVKSKLDLSLSHHCATADVAIMRGTDASKRLGWLVYKVHAIKVSI